MIQVITVLGARPQFIKAAVVSRALAARGGARERLLHTGQHYDPQMSGVFFEDLDLPTPAWDLGIGSGPHGQQTGRMLESIERVLLEERPDWVLVYGDTNSTLAGALAAAKLRIPVAHVEAGLRSFNRAMPEELNRIATDHLSDLLLAPTATAMGHLAREGIATASCHLVGDVMYDSVVHAKERARSASDILARERLGAGQYILATIHRAENTDDVETLRIILEGLEAVSSELEVVLPLHPRTRATLADMGHPGLAGTRVRLLEPVGYFEMLALEGGASLILTDSGGVQKEAFFQRVPCLTLRHETEWTELVDAGWNRLVPPRSAAAIAEAARQALAEPRPTEPAVPLYGGGTAGSAIAALLVEQDRDPA